jgi:hypothetical protein
MPGFPAAVGAGSPVRPTVRNSDIAILPKGGSKAPSKKAGERYKNSTPQKSDLRCFHMPLAIKPSSNVYPALPSSDAPIGVCHNVEHRSSEYDRLQLPSRAAERPSSMAVGRDPCDVIEAEPENRMLLAEFRLAEPRADR